MLLGTRAVALCALSFLVFSKSLSSFPDSVTEQIIFRRKGVCSNLEDLRPAFTKILEATQLRLRGGAEVGKGDPRWIVKERDDGKNVGAWHWEERDMFPFARSEQENGRCCES